MIDLVILSELATCSIHLVHIHQGKWLLERVFKVAYKIKIYFKHLRPLNN